MSAYYNEFDPFAAAWLRELIKAGHIAPGDVDERSIVEVKADDLRGYTQCHFFAGIGGWSLALRLAMWPDDRPVWTGSAPCQPFSSAGKQKGKADIRHLFPVWLDLIRERRPATIFGEQVASAIAHGWLDDVYQGLEAEGYAVGSAILPACSVGAPHKRDRLWFVAYSTERGREQRNALNRGLPEESGALQERSGPTDSNSDVANSSSGRCSGTSKGEIQQPGRAETIGSGKPMADTDDERSQGRELYAKRTCEQPFGATSLEWLECADGKARLIESGIPLLANGVSNRVGKLRGYGNAIVPQVAAEFIKAAEMI